MEASTDPPVARMDTHKYTLDSGVVTTWLEDSHQTTKVLLSLFLHACGSVAVHRHSLQKSVHVCRCVCAFPSESHSGVRKLLWV